MKELTNLLNKAAEKIRKTDTLIQVVSHLDADGLSSAAIIASVLIKLKKDFQITIVKMIKPDIVELIENRKPELVIFTDIGSGYLDILKQIKADSIILDHHEIEGSPSENMIHINPEDFEIQLAGAGTAYLLAKEILQNNSLAPLAIVGTIGDVNYPTNSRLFETPLIEAEMGLNLFGRFSRPLYRSIEYSGIPSIDSSSKAIQFLSEIGIESQKNGDWITPNDLDENDRKKLADALVKESLKYGKFKTKNIFSNNLTLKNFPEELRDPKEFAMILNACANMNDSATGIALCLGSKKALETSRGIVRGYRRLISNYMKWVENNPKNIRQTKHATYIMAGDYINDNLIGTIVSMLFKPSEKTIFGFANAEDGIKVSGRSKKVDIQKIITEAASFCNGRGGGHEFAAGATIPANTQERFIEKCENLLKDST